MSCQNTTPCRDCPWRRKACPGWLGSDHSREEWLRIAHGEDEVECHKVAHHQCAGLAIYRANVSKKPKDPNVLRLPADPVNVFSTPMEFMDYHTRMGVISSEPNFRGSCKLKEATAT